MRGIGTQTYKKVKVKGREMREWKTAVDEKVDETSGRYVEGGGR